MDRQRPTRHARHGAVLALLFAVIGLGLGVTGRAADGSVVVAAQETTTSRPGILVPGPTVPPSSTTVIPTTTVADESGLSDRVRDMFGDETGRTVAIAIGGLLLVALVLAILTVRYWRTTRPAPKELPVSTLGRGGRSREPG